MALFRGSDSESTNGVCFAASWQAHEIVAPEAPHSHAAFLSIRPDASSSEGERYMTDTDHPVRHPLVHHQILGRVRRRRSCAWHDDQFGRGQNTGLGWSDPTFVHVSVPKVIRWGRSSPQLRGDRAEYFVRVQMDNDVQDGLEPPEFLNRVRSRRGPQSCQAEMKTTLNF